MVRTNTAVGHLLRAAVGARAPYDLAAGARAAFQTVDAAALVTVAELHRVTGCVLVAARAAAAPSSVIERLSAENRGTAGGHLRAVADLQRISAVLHDVTPWLVVKGPVLAGYAYPRPDMRRYLDLDLLVPPDRLGGALQALEADGFAVLDRNWDMFVRELPGEVHLRTPYGGMLDLHWHLQNDRRSREATGIGAASLWERRRTVPVNGGAIPTLDAVDTLLHLCLHAARSGGHRMIWLKDIQQVWWRDRPDPATVAARAREWGVELATVLMLGRTQRTLGDPGVGAGVPQALDTGRDWLTFFAAVDRLAPVERAGTGSSLTRVVARAVATDPSHAALEGARRSVTGVRHLLDGHTDDNTWDPASPDSVVYESGGERQRTAYLAAVALQGSTGT